MMAEHKYAELLRAAAEDENARFDCDGGLKNQTIEQVILGKQYNWRVAEKTKRKVKKWLWATDDGYTTDYLLSEDEIAVVNCDGNRINYTTKLLWSETEFEE